MLVHVAVSKRRAKRLAGGIIREDQTLGWHLILYSIVDDQIAPFGINPFSSRDAAFTDAADTLKVTEEDWVEIDEDAAENYILENAKNRWSPEAHASRKGLGGSKKAP